MTGNSILIISPSWIGDVIMSMPAVQMLRAAHPQADLTVLCKPGVVDLWNMHPVPNAVLSQEKTNRLLSTAQTLRQRAFDRACILPNSFRSAWIPFLAGIPHRSGFRGQWRRGLLTDIIARPAGHQQFEAMNILGVQGDPPLPQLRIPAAGFQTLEKKIEQLPTLGKTAVKWFQNQDKPLITLLPGAARGPAKRWPPQYFLELARRLRAEDDAAVFLGGGPEDVSACEEIASRAGDGVLSLAGRTNLFEWAALLKRSRCVVANDSGGMHLAAAVGTPVAAIFGITDPRKTGPLGRAAVLQQSTVRSRAVARRSSQAAEALAAVSPADVLDAVRTLLSSADLVPPAERATTGSI